MAQVILKGSQQTQWNIGNRFICGGIKVELTDEEVSKHTDVILEIVGQKKETFKNNEAKKYTEEQLFAMTKDEQIAILNSLGVTIIPKLEKARIKAILEAQK